MPELGFPVSQLFPPSPPPPSRWDRLPDCVKLILVKELTSWYKYSEAIQLLRLSAAQERAFRGLYNGELTKQKHFDKAIRAKIDARDRELFGNWPYTSLDKPAPSHARAQAQGMADGQSRDPIVPGVPRLELLTDYITVQNLKLGEEYLVAIGFDRSWVDLGHWTGHAGTSRFEIEMDPVGHHQRACGAGSQGTGPLQRQAPERPSWAARLEQLKQLTQAPEQIQAQKRAQSQARRGQARGQSQAPDLTPTLVPAQTNSQAHSQAHSQARFQARSSPRLSSYRLLSDGIAENSRSSPQATVAEEARPIKIVDTNQQPTTPKRGRGRPRVDHSRSAVRKRELQAAGCQQTQTTMDLQENQELPSQQGLTGVRHAAEDGKFELN